MPQRELMEVLSPEVKKLAEQLCDMADKHPTFTPLEFFYHLVFASAAVWHAVIRGNLDQELVEVMKVISANEVAHHKNALATLLEKMADDATVHFDMAIRQELKVLCTYVGAKKYANR